MHGSRLKILLLNLNSYLEKIVDHCYNKDLILVKPKGRQLYKTLEKNNLKFLTTGETTYWPTDRNKELDLVHFCVTKGIPQHFAIAKLCPDLAANMRTESTTDN